MEITTDIIKKLRDQTGVSVMQCKKALEEAKGDLEKALVLLRKKSGDIASKKEGRTLKASAIASYIHSNGSVGAMVELSTETDFVARNEDFRKLAYDIAMQVAATNPEFLKTDDITDDAKKVALEAFESEVKGKPENIKEKILQGKLDSYFAEKTLLNQPYIKDGERSVKDIIQEAIQKFGEKIEVVRFVRYSSSH